MLGLYRMLESLSFAAVASNESAGKCHVCPSGRRPSEQRKQPQTLNNKLIGRCKNIFIFLIGKNPRSIISPLGDILGPSLHRHSHCVSPSFHSSPNSHRPGQHLLVSICTQAKQHRRLCCANALSSYTLYPPRILLGGRIFLGSRNCTLCSVRHCFLPRELKGFGRS